MARALNFAENQGVSHVALTATASCSLPRGDLQRAHRECASVLERTLGRQSKHGARIAYHSKNGRFSATLEFARAEACKRALEKHRFIDVVDGVLELSLAPRISDRSLYAHEEFIVILENAATMRELGSWELFDAVSRLGPVFNLVRDPGRQQALVRFCCVRDAQRAVACRSMRVGHATVAIRAAGAGRRSVAERARQSSRAPPATTQLSEEASGEPGEESGAEPEPVDSQEGDTAESEVAQMEATRATMATTQGDHDHDYSGTLVPAFAQSMAPPPPRVPAQHEGMRCQRCDARGDYLCVPDPWASAASAHATVHMYLCYACHVASGGDALLPESRACAVCTQPETSRVVRLYYS